jgi:pyruvate dehydrogenase E1 component alpha subunit
MRRMEQACDALYKSKMIRGFCHLAIGQEAVSVGMESAITGEDRVITSYRCHPFAVLRGGTIKGVVAELMGESSLWCVDGKVLMPRRTSGGYVQRKGWIDALVHPFVLRWKRYCWCPGPSRSRYRIRSKVLEEEDGHLCNVRRWSLQPGSGVRGLQHGQFCFATSVRKADKQAKLWDLPCVFVCENNKYGMGTSAERSSMNTEYFTRGDKIAGLQVGLEQVQ